MLSSAPIQPCPPYRREAAAEIRAACSQAGPDSWGRLCGEDEASRSHPSEQGTRPPHPVTAVPCHPHPAVGCRAPSQPRAASFLPQSTGLPLKRVRRAGAPRSPREASCGLSPSLGCCSRRQEGRHAAAAAPRCLLTPLPVLPAAWWAGSSRRGEHPLLSSPPCPESPAPIAASSVLLRVFLPTWSLQHQVPAGAASRS